MSKICPNCGAEMSATAKFCTACGFNLSNVTPTEATTNGNTNNVQSTAADAANHQQQAAAQATTQDTTQQAQQAEPVQPNQQQAATEPNPNVEATKEYARGYWSYLLDSVKHPFTIDKNFHQYFGLTSLIVTALFSAWSVFNVTNSTIGSATGTIDSLLGTSTSQNKLGFKAFIELLIMIALFEFVTASISYVVAYAFLGDKRYNYLNSLNNYAHFTNIAVFVSAGALLFSLLGDTKGFVFFLLALTILLFSVAFVTQVFKAQATTNFDRVYAYILGMVILAFAYFIISIIFGGIFASSAINMFSNLNY
ncbi:zinc ribbon domain-containing protein [Lapidilactobacillus bayanensis]|uniref:zinc ribbon domain-containing protein n=1 Tax=Lapidilactobacillus bayanensis TaxID=2485998 RepID=UPI000F7686F3|nr:zinc ribbon domain-containing protein [Lapidilactobacillus bayanensis]